MGDRLWILFNGLRPARAGLTDYAPAGLSDYAPAGLLDNALSGLMDGAPAGLTDYALSGLVEGGEWVDLHRVRFVRKNNIFPYPAHWFYSRVRDCSRRAARRKARPEG